MDFTGQSRLKFVKYSSLKTVLAAATLQYLDDKDDDTALC